MSDFRQMYFTHAAEYDELIKYEDWQGNLFRALDALRSFEQADMVEWGAGTGRLTLLAAPHAQSILALDRSPAMLQQAARHLRAFERLRWQVAVADHLHAPAASRSADLICAGWTLCYLLPPYESTDWQRRLDRVLEEMRRVVRPGGTLIIIETLGTGYTTPTIVAPELGAYFEFLENERGFQRTWVRTDYQFPSLEVAAHHLEWFFGAELVAQVEANNWLITPECTGIWWQKAK